MAFTAEEFANYSNANIDYHIKGQPQSQIIQDRPLYNDLNANKKTFGGGKELIDGPVKGVYTSQYRGYSHDDAAHFANPANIKRWQARWYEMEVGIQMTFTELKGNGIHVTDSTTGKNTSTASDTEIYQLCNLLDDKMEDLMEGSRRSFAEIEWRDGTQDAKVFPGIQSFMLTSPSTGTSFGIDRASNSWWRNRASIGIDSSTAANQNLVNTLQREIRQLRRFGKRKPNHHMYAGSDLMDAWEKELRSKGNYTQEGWARSKRIDAGMADLAFKGIDVQYEPLLDDLGLSKYLYVLDLAAIKLWPMESEDEKMHYPARPAEIFAIYRSMTWTGALCVDQLNTSGVYTIL